NQNGIEIFTSSNGCDSVVTITLSYSPVSTGSENYLGCEDDGYSVTVNGNIYNENNPTGTETLVNSTGCDSVVTINLIYNPGMFETETYSGCEGDGYEVSVNGTVYNESNPTGTEILIGSIDCGSTVTISLYYAPTSTGSETYNGCSGDAYSVVVNGTIYNETNPVGVEILVNSVGCDSIVTIDLNFVPLGNGTEVYNGCSGDAYSVIVNGTTYDEVNPTGIEILTGTNGCDSIVTINLSFSAPGFGTETYSGCFDDGYFVVVNGTNYNQSNPSGTEIFTGSNGCDTTVTIDLLFAPILMGNETYSGCEGDGYSVVVNGTTYDEFNTAGTEMIDLQGCDSIVEINLFYAPLELVSISNADPLCTSAPVLTLTAIPSGGQWSGAVNSDQFDPSILGPGLHQVIYTVNPDACVVADTIEITIYELVITCQTIQHETLPGDDDGVGEVSVTGGNAPYVISWSGPESGSGIMNADGSFTMDDLMPGVYTVVVSDVFGCPTTCQFVINPGVPCEIVIDDVNIQDATCSGINDGSITILASGGVMPYEYSIDGINFQSSNIFTDIAPGSYTVYVLDETGCIVSQTVIVGVGPGPSLAVIEIENAFCGIANGSIQVTATNGSTPYTYSLDGITYSLSGLFSGLGAGDYQVYLIDAVGCTDTIPASIIASDAPAIDAMTITNSSCGNSDGIITVEASGGFGLLEYS
ncbi:MAG: SprB repeat-containing protein, partial [Saprospiraceae bacterium]